MRKKKAYSDAELVSKIKVIARRTLAKYRLEAGISGTPERNQAYRSGERTEPYRIG